MKSKEEILEHLKNVSYSKCAINKILGFLIGKGIKEENENINVLWDNGNKSEWSDFWSWYNDDMDAECILCSLLSDLSDKINEADDKELKERYQLQLDFLLEEFEVGTC